MNAPAHGLTGLLGRIADVAGVKAALALAEARGGRQMPFSARPDGVLASIVGHDAAMTIVKEIGSGKMTIPMGHMRGQRGRREAAARMLRAGATVSQVTAAVDVHERTVFRIKSAEPSAAPLLDGLDD